MNASKADKLPPLHTSLVTLLMQILQAHAHATVRTTGYVPTGGRAPSMLRAIAGTKVPYAQWRLLLICNS
jgi:hypothetical protein